MTKIKKCEVCQEVFEEMCDDECTKKQSRFGKLTKLFAGRCEVVDEVLKGFDDLCQTDVLPQSTVPSFRLQRLQSSETNVTGLIIHTNLSGRLKTDIFYEQRCFTYQTLHTNNSHPVTYEIKTQTKMLQISNK